MPLIIQNPADQSLNTIRRPDCYVRHSARMLLAGIGLILSAIATDLIGSTYQLLVVLILSLALAVAGAVVAIRGMVEFLGELL